MTRRLLALTALVLLGLSLSGCSKCGDWFWERGSRACHSEKVN